MDSTNTCELYWDWLSFSPSIHLSNHLSFHLPTYLFTYLPIYLINSLNKGIQWGATSSSSSQEIPHILRNLKVHHHIHNSLLLTHTLSQINHPMLYHPIPLRSISILSSHLSLRLPSSHFSLILGDIISLWFYLCVYFLLIFTVKINTLFFRFPTKNVHTPLPPTSHSATCCILPILRDMITQIIFGDEQKSWSSSLCSCLQPPVTPNTSGPNILLRTISWTQSWSSSLCSCLQPPVTPNTTGPNIFLRTLFFNPSAWGHLNPSSYCDVGRLFYGVFKLWSKLQRKKMKK